MRHEILMNDGWKFHKGDIPTKTPLIKAPIYTQSKTERKKSGPAAYGYMDNESEYLRTSGRIISEAWYDVKLPHDYVIDQDITNVDTNNALGFVRYENAWYRKSFDLPEDCSGKRVLIRFDGIAGKSTIYLNGCIMYHNYSSYNTFEVDVSDYIFFNRENRLAIYVNTEEWEGWWYQGGGIYRNVYLVITEPVAIDLWGVYAPYRKINETDWQIDFETTVINSNYDHKFVTVESYILNDEGEMVASASGQGEIRNREKGTLKYSTAVHNPLLWDCDNPSLYTVKTILKSEGEEVDVNDTRIGFRTVEITADRGLLLNGKRIFIKGVCAHQDFGITGIAVPDNVARYKVSLLKEMGANGYRTSHYQQHTAYMDAFDKMGFLVMDEVRWFESTKESFGQIESLVKRDRNRPSVILWSTSNEEPSHITDVGKRIHRAMAAHIRKLDHTKPITLAQDKKPDKSTVFDYCDVIGINYNLNIYDTIHAMRPDVPIFASECCATGTTRDWHFESNTNSRVRDYDTDTNSWFTSREKAWKFFMERPYIFGAYQWAAFEHRGEAEWPAICSKSGAIDLFLQKKGAFYQNQSHWIDEPMVHIVPHWNFKGLKGQEIFVPVYTNCDELELFLNSKSYGRKSIEKYGHGEWHIPYEKGELLVLGYKKGKVVCEDKRITTGKPVALKLTLDNDFEMTGRDLALFTCECVDKNGNTVPDASVYVRFSVNAPAKIVGTGSDNMDHHNVKNNERQMYMGKIRVAVEPQEGQKEIILMAQSNNTKPCRLVIRK